MDRMAFSLQRDGVKPTLRRSPSAPCRRWSTPRWCSWARSGPGWRFRRWRRHRTPEQLVMMLNDCDAGLFFLDDSVAKALAPVAGQIKARRIALDAIQRGRAVRGMAGARGPCRPNRSPSIPNGRSTSSIPPAPPARQRASCRAMPCAGCTSIAATRRAMAPARSTMVSTPLYSNTTLVSFFPTIALGGTGGADEEVRYGEVPGPWPPGQDRATHAMLVPGAATGG